MLQASVVAKAISDPAFATFNPRGVFIFSTSSVSGLNGLL